MTTIELLTRYKAHHGGITNYRAAKMLGIRPQTISAWKMGGYMSDETAIRMAESIGLDPVKVLIDLNLEKNQGNAAYHTWKALSDRLNMAAMPMVVGFVGYWLGVIYEAPLM